MGSNDPSYRPEVLYFGIARIVIWSTLVFYLAGVMMGWW